ncbi:hypothetical protein [Nocardiopsis algeriensis]|uniref:Uncharacterized protein n=1 Tax=Nocardiopsis algeriensis TaxID=1478215 RepID=A0A841IKG8_9ACTN|nr:hypothetical protein [Nocardiopsis algeriensis]MBB6119153.1 hypothetical protein [Nocardiopsis algeriensis]
MPLDPNMPESARTAIKVLTGIEVPTANPHAMRAAAEIYRTLEDRLLTVLVPLVETVRRRVRTNFDGRTADFYDRSLDQFTKGDNDYIGSAAHTSRTLTTELRKGAANAEYMAMMVIGQFVQLALEIAWAIATAKFTFGASLKLIPVFKAIRSLAIRRILAWFLLTVPSHQILSQIFASLDSIIQRLQIDNGTRDTWDNKLTKGAHTGAVFEGLVSAGLAGGIDLFLSNRISKVFNDHLDNLRTLPDPVPAPKTTGPDPLPAPRNTDPAPDPVPDSAPAPRDAGSDAGPGTDPLSPLNGDLADLFGRHGNEFLASFSGGTPGRVPWDNAANATQLRDDLSDLFTRHFADHLGTTGARDLGRDYADTLIRHWNTPDLHGQLKNTLGNQLPPHLRDHLADSPAHLQQALHQHNGKATTYLQHLGLGAGSGALEGYLGEGLGNAAQGEGWKASVWSATAGASQAGTQQVTTDSALAGINALTTPPTLPDPLTPPPPTQTDSGGEDPPTTNTTGPDNRPSLDDRNDPDDRDPGSRSSSHPDHGTSDTDRPRPGNNEPSESGGAAPGSGPRGTGDGQNTAPPREASDGPGTESPRENTDRPEQVAEDSTSTSREESSDDHDWPLGDMPDFRTGEGDPPALGAYPDRSPFDPLGLLDEKPGTPWVPLLSPKEDSPFSDIPFPGYQGNLTVFMLNELSVTGPHPAPEETDPATAQGGTEQAAEAAPAPFGPPQAPATPSSSGVGGTPPPAAEQPNSGRDGNRPSQPPTTIPRSAPSVATSNDTARGEFTTAAQPPTQSAAQDTSASSATHASPKEAGQPSAPTNTGRQEDTSPAAIGRQESDPSSSHRERDSDVPPDHRPTTGDDGFDEYLVLAEAYEAALAHTDPADITDGSASGPEPEKAADAGSPAERSGSQGTDTGEEGVPSSAQPVPAAPTARTEQPAPPHQDRHTGSGQPANRRTGPQGPAPDPSVPTTPGDTTDEPADPVAGKDTPAPEPAQPPLKTSAETPAHTANTQEHPIPTAETDPSKNDPADKKDHSEENTPRPEEAPLPRKDPDRPHSDTDSWETYSTDTNPDTGQGHSSPDRPAPVPGPRPDPPTPSSRDRRPASGRTNQHEPAPAPSAPGNTTGEPADSANAADNPASDPTQPPVEASAEPPALTGRTQVRPAPAPQTDTTDTDQKDHPDQAPPTSEHSAPQNTGTDRQSTPPPSQAAASPPAPQPSSSASLPRDRQPESGHLNPHVPPPASFVPDGTDNATGELTNFTTATDTPTTNPAQPLPQTSAESPAPPQTARSEQEDRPEEDEFRLGPLYIDRRSDPRFSHTPPRFYPRHLTDDDLNTPHLSNDPFTDNDPDTTPHHNPTDNETLPPEGETQPETGVTSDPEQKNRSGGDQLRPDKNPPPPGGSSRSHSGGHSTDSNPDPGSGSGTGPSNARHDIGYLLTSDLVNPGMLNAREMASFMDRNLHGNAGTGRPADAVRDNLRKKIAQQAGRSMAPFFAEDGFSTAVEDANGITWQATVSLRPGNNGFLPVTVTEKDKEVLSQIALSAEAGEANPISGSSSRGSSKQIALAFHASPITVGAVNGNPLGPSVYIRVAGGTRMRSTGQSTTNTNEASTGHEVAGEQKLYVSDLVMSVTLERPPNTAASGGGHNPVNLRYTAPDGLRLVLPREVRAPVEDAPRSFGRQGNDTRPLAPPTGSGHPLSVGPVRRTDNRQSLPDWLHDRLWTDKEKSWFYQNLHSEKSKQKHLEDFRAQVDATFSTDSMRANLTRMSQGPVIFPVTTPSGRSRLVGIYSAPTSYRAKSDMLPPDKLSDRTKATRESGSSTSHSKNASATLGIGLNVDVPVDSARRGRLDIPGLDFSGSKGSAKEKGQSSSGSVARSGYSTSEAATYDVDRIFHVYVDGSSESYTFTGTSVETLTVEEARAMSEQVRAASSAPAPNTRPNADGSGSGSGSAPARPARPNLAQQVPVTFHGATPRELTWPDGSRHRTDNGDRFTVQQEIAHRILTALAQERPGMVLPDLVRDPSNFAHRPDRQNANRSWREHRPFRRSHDAAVFNTQRVMDAVSETMLKSSLDDLTLHGIPVHLVETAWINPSDLFKKDAKMLRPPFVTVRITADFSPLTPGRTTERGTGGEYSGASGRSSGSSKQKSGGIALKAGSYIRSNAGDASKFPKSAGIPSLSLELNNSRGSGRGQGTSSQTEDVVRHPEGSQAWGSDVRVSARLYEHDDLGMAQGDDRGILLTGKPVSARIVLETPESKEGAAGGTSRTQPPGTTAASGTPIRPLTTDEAKALIDGRPAPRNNAPQGLGEERARLLEQALSTVEHIGTRLRTGGSNDVGSLLEAAYKNFSATPLWGDGFAFERKLRHFLASGQGAHQFYENLFSPENLAGHPALTSSGGLRARTEMSGGPLSPRNLRPTMTTRMDIDSIDRFEQSDAEIGWKDTVSLNTSFNKGKGTSLGLKVSGAGRFNPNPLVSSEETAHTAPNSAKNPTLNIGGGAGWNFYQNSTGQTTTANHSRTVEFHPQVQMSYAFTGSGTVSQAMEFILAALPGIPIPLGPQYRAWQARVPELITGLIHVREAHHAGLVRDRVAVNDDGSLTLRPQPGSDAPKTVRIRPGFEDSGKLLKPADPSGALRDLTDKLAAKGWELTAGSREAILQALTSHTGLHPNTGVPLPVKVRSSSSPRAIPSRDATVTLKLRNVSTSADYLSGRAEYHQEQTRENTSEESGGRGSSVSGGTNASPLLALPQSGGDQPGGESPTSRPVYGRLTALDHSTSSSTGTSTGRTDTNKRTLGLTMDTPYVRLSMKTELTIDLTLAERRSTDENRPGDTAPAGTTPAGSTPARNAGETAPEETRVFTGVHDSGTVSAFYPAPYLDLSPAPATTAISPGSSGPAGDRGVLVVEDSSDDPHLSLGEMMRAWTTDKDPQAHNDVRDTPLLPVSVEDRGQGVRDTAHITVARSLGWTPPAGSVRNGRYTKEAVTSARAYAARELGLNSHHNAIDQSLSEIALRSVLPDATANEGSELIRIGRTTWNIRAMPILSSARFLDYNPEVRLTDSAGSSTSSSSARNHSGTQSSGPEFQPLAVHETAPTASRVLSGIATVPLSSTSSGETSRGGGTQEDSSDGLRGGPAYLVEFDTRVAIGARSEKHGAFVRKVKRAGRAVQNFFGGHSESRPARFQRGETSAKVAVWVSESDLRRFGLLGAAADTFSLRVSAGRLADAQKALAEADKAYLEARRPLEKAAADWVASPGDTRAKQRYEQLEADYQDRREAFTRAREDWEEALGDLRYILGGLNTGNRTASGLSRGKPPATRNNRFSSMPPIPEETSSSSGNLQNPPVTDQGIELPDWPGTGTSSKAPTEGQGKEKDVGQQGAGGGSGGDRGGSDLADYFNDVLNSSSSKGKGKQSSTG